MDSKAIHEAMQKKTPVRYGGYTYIVKEYISWFDTNGHHRLSVGLIKDNCYLRAPADKVEVEE